MTTVNFPTQCPQCQFDEASGSLCISTGEESLFCSMCGYNEKVRAIVDRQRQAADPEKRRWLKKLKNGHLAYRRIIHRGYGAYCLWANDVGCSGSFTGPLTRQTELQWFRDTIKRIGADPKRCFVSWWNAKTQQVEILHGSQRRQYLI